MSASNYLSYGGVLRVVRTDNTNLNNANAGVSVASTTAKIESYENYVNNHSTASDWYYAAKDPGRWANGLRVCTIDGYADQTFTGVTTSQFIVGAGVTQTLVGKVNPGDGSTTTFTGGFLRGVVTGIGEGEVYVKVVDQVTSAGVSSPATYAQGSVNKFDNPVTTADHVVNTGFGATTAVLDAAYDITVRYNNSNIY